MANTDPTVQRNPRSQRGHQPSGVRWNDRERVARVPGLERHTLLRPRDRRQHVSDRLALQHIQSGPIMGRTQCPPICRKAPRNDLVGIQLLLGLTTHKRRLKCGSRPPLVCREWRPWQGASLGVTQRFCDYLSSQVPANFEICQLPSEILSWVTRVLRITASSLGVVRKAGTRTSTESGDGGLGSESTSDTLLTPTSLCYLTTNKSYIPKLSSSATEGQTGLKGGPLQELVRDQWLQALSAKPQATWLRRFVTISGQAPFTSRAVRTCAHLSDPCLKRTRMTIPQATNNEPSPQNY